MKNPPERSSKHRWQGSFVLALICVAFLASQAHAQTAEDLARRDIKNRVNRVIDTTMKIADDRAADFNAHIAAINEARPLDLQNFDSARVAANVSRILEFVDYLARIRTTDDSLAHVLEDSLFIIEAGMPESQDQGALQAFQESYTADRKAFDAYVVTLRKLYSKVLDVLLFIQHVEYKVQNEQLQFKSSNDIAKYRKLMKPIDATSKELKKASDRSRKATEWANQKIAEINSSGSPQPQVIIHRPH